MQHLRFDDKDTRAEQVKTDKFAAISDIWTRFNKNCAESFTPGEHMTIDEQLFPTKVRCPFSQYIATKPGKFGIKFWMATDLETKYVCSASPYLGKDPSRQKGERLAESVVMNLMEPFLDDGRNVTTDSFFTSPSLLHRLLQRKTTLLGTAQVRNGRNRKPTMKTDYNHMKGVALHDYSTVLCIKADRPRQENHFFFTFLGMYIRMASVSLRRRKNRSSQQALARLQEMDEADSDGGKISFVQQATDTSSEDSEKETEQEPYMPPRKKHRV
ncbi:uncharacterized protein LOC125139768 [Tachysurus fulvidraco]|uniref:uncharacterized protein LOC125139768 n=1 Tax=Tachysurus fulvidraco TaxID=1234273 RepID=UPI001FED7AA7|nr:uncharacterized protein LOC125139768 [Tachysurus fulvidraco]